MTKYYDEEEKGEVPKPSKQSNVLPIFGNAETMNLNPLILTNIQNSIYFKKTLFDLKTYHEVIDEIYYQVNHLEPWEKGSKSISGQFGMCGGVRGVGTSGIASSAYSLLYKLFTLKLTRKQLNGLITHCDSPYIRALGFLYIRYTQPPNSLLDWYEPYLNDEEEIEVNAGGGQVTQIGILLRQWLLKLEWFSTVFPRIPVVIEQKLQKYLDENFTSRSAKGQRFIAGHNLDKERKRESLRDNRDVCTKREKDEEKYLKDRKNREHRSGRKHRERSRSRERSQHRRRRRT